MLLSQVICCLLCHIGQSIIIMTIKNLRVCCWKCLCCINAFTLGQCFNSKRASDNPFELFRLQADEVTSVVFTSKDNKVSTLTSTIRQVSNCCICINNNFHRIMESFKCENVSLFYWLCWGQQYLSWLIFLYWLSLDLIHKNWCLVRFDYLAKSCPIFYRKTFFFFWGRNIFILRMVIGCSVLM